MPYPCTDDPNEILEYVGAAKSNAQKFNTFVNGSNTQTVQLGTGNPTPTLRKFIADAQSVVATAANDAAETVLDDVADMKLNKADKFVPAEPGNIAELNFKGNLRDAGRAVEDFVLLLAYASNEAIELVWQNRMAIKHYREWVDRHERDMDMLAYANGEAVELTWQNRTALDRFNDWHRQGIDRIAEVGSIALAAAQRTAAFIDGFDEQVARHRLQVRLFDGTNPATSSKPVLFVISGQSNGEGCGEGGVFETAEDCGQFWSWADGANVLKPIKDPVGQIDSRGYNGSAWPSFARRFFALTGRKVLFVSIASGGSSVTDVGTTANTWADNAYGRLRSRGQTIWDAFSAAVPASEYDVGAILWSQGENDAGRLYAGSITVQQYKEATLDVFNWMRSLIGTQNCPVFMAKIAYNINAYVNSGYRAAYHEIQKAQDELCDWETIFMGLEMTPHFADAWDYYITGVVHYSPVGYKIMGNAMARSVVNYLNL